MPKEHNEFSLETIFQICHELKKNGKTICFTHGGFDLFHYGHLHLLRESKKQAHFLIVAVDPDENLAKYKIYKRPIINQDRRLEIVQELNCVNLAFINRLPMTGKDYKYLYKELKADTVTIGRNFSFEQGIKRDLSDLKKKLVKIDNDFDSTSNIINTILKKYSDQT